MLKCASPLKSSIGSVFLVFYYFLFRFFLLIVLAFSFLGFSFTCIVLWIDDLYFLSPCSFLVARAAPFLPLPNPRFVIPFVFWGRWFFVWDRCGKLISFLSLLFLNFVYPSSLIVGLLFGVLSFDTLPSV